MIFKGCGVAKDSIITTVNGVMPAERLPREFDVLDAVTGRKSSPRTARVLSFGAVRLSFSDGAFIMASPGCEVLLGEGTWADARSIVEGILVQGEESTVEVTDVEQFSVVLAATAFRSIKPVAIVSDGIVIRATTTQQWERERCRY